MDWCILRCKGSSTLRLVRSLELDGFSAWTPTEIQVRRNSRTRARMEAVISVLPTYVFACAENLPDLMELSMAPATIHPDFSIFRHNNRFPLIADDDLNELRKVERQAAAKQEPVRFNKGQPVKVPDGPYQGLTGQVVETTRGKFTLVAFPGFNIPVKFASWTLEKAA